MTARLRSNEPHLARAAAAGLAVAAAASFAPLSTAAESCTARSAGVAPPVVELYTSEGCSSCPPADKWLTALKADPGVVALAFHVDYWDRLGWKDRFASAAWTARQAEQQRVNGARFSYTPQVVVDGRDRPDWSGLKPQSSRPAAPVAVALEKKGDRVVASVTASAAAPKRLAAYWAVTEDAHVTNVRSGENGGATLRHDFVVRDLKTVPAWAADPAAAKSIEVDVGPAADATHRRQVNFVVVDADSGRPVQALKIGC